MMACVKVNAKSFALMIASISLRSRTLQSIADETGLHKATVGNYIRELHKVGLCHISGWEKDRLGRDCIPIFTWGFGADKKRHKYSSAQRQARCRAKKKLEEQLDAQSRRKVSRGHSEVALPAIC